MVNAEAESDSRGFEDVVHGQRVLFLLASRRSLRDKLEAHLSVLKRQRAITTWHDRRLTAGSDFAGAIDAAIETSDVILLLVSSDFLNSGYCQDVEVARALELNAEGKATVIPVILRACDWQNSPLGGLLAAPRDGKPIIP